jgi:hypothetical protein
MISYKSLVKSKFNLNGNFECVPGFVITAEDITELVEEHGFIDLVASDDPFSKSAVNSILENTLDIKFDNKVEKIFNELGRGIYSINGDITENVNTYRDFYTLIIRYTSDIISSNSEYMIVVRKVMNYDLHGYCRRDLTNNMFIVESEYGAMDFNQSYTDTYFINEHGAMVDYYTQNQQTIRVIEGTTYKYLKLPSVFATKNKLKQAKIEELVSVFKKNEDLDNFSYGYKSGKLYLEDFNIVEDNSMIEELSEEEEVENIQLATEVYALMDGVVRSDAKVNKTRSFYFDILKNSNVFSNLPLISGAKRYFSVENFEFAPEKLLSINNEFAGKIDQYLEYRQIDHLLLADFHYSLEKYAALLALTQRHGFTGHLISPSIITPDDSLGIREVWNNLDEKSMKLNLQIAVPSVLGYAKKFGVPVTYNIDRLMFNLFEGEKDEEINDYLETDCDYSILVSRGNLRLLDKKVVEKSRFIIIR